MARALDESWRNTEWTGALDELVTLEGVTGTFPVALDLCWRVEDMDRWITGAMWKKTKT
jgi:hypothetical protein